MGFCHSSWICVHAATPQRAFEETILVFLARGGGLADVQTMYPNNAILGGHLVETVRFGLRLPIAAPVVFN